MSSPASIAACMVGGSSTMFYVDEGDYIHTIAASQEAERAKGKGRTNYNDSILEVDGNELQSKTKELAALSYELTNNVIRSKLYYADENGILQGLDRDSTDKGWSKSSIGELGAHVVEGSSISALVSPPSDLVKVYYWTPGKHQPQVAWWSGNGGSWQTAGTA